jgi:uncharacterized protein (TIGR02300 family)
MPARDLGRKHDCFKCGTKFYDLKKPAPICPKCGADQRERPAQRGPSPAAEKKRAPAPVEPEAEELPAADLEDEPEEPVEEDVETSPEDE